MSLRTRAITVAYATANFTLLVLPTLALAAEKTEKDAPPMSGTYGEDKPLNLPDDAPKQVADAGASGGDSLVRTFVGLAVVVAVIYGLYWVLRQLKSSREERSVGTGLSSQAVVPLGPNRSLHLVRAGRELVLVGVLRGVACFMADLMRSISVPVRVDFLALSPYQPDGGALRFTKPLEEEIAGADVLVVEDVVDTGMSLHRLLQYIRRREPASVRVCTLLDKRARRVADAPIEYTGFEIGDEFVVGYGLDYQQQYRNLPFIATLKRPE